MILTRSTSFYLAAIPPVILQRRGVLLGLCGVETFIFAGGTAGQQLLGAAGGQQQPQQQTAAQQKQQATAGPKPKPKKVSDKQLIISQSRNRIYRVYYQYFM